jgi:hypothetical protein
VGLKPRKRSQILGDKHFMPTEGKKAGEPDQVEQAKCKLERGILLEHMLVPSTSYATESTILPPYFQPLGKERR